jgi:cytochrome P450
MIKKFEDDVQRTAAGIIDDLLATGPCDFVAHVSAQLPLKIICQMMGIGDEHYGMVLKDTNTILSGTDTEFVSADSGQAVTQILTAGAELASLVTELAARRQRNPGNDLTSANIDGEQVTPAELASFFILLVVAGNETPRTALSHALTLRSSGGDRPVCLPSDLDAAIDNPRHGSERAAIPRG